MDLGLKGKKALVCASSKGLGKGIAKGLAMEGAEVLMCARSEDALLSAAEEVKAVAAAPVHSIPCDLSTREGRDQLVQEAWANLGHVDILIHNVGGPPPSKVETTSLDAWEQGFQQNFLSIAQLNEAFVPGMKERRWGRIICVTSLSAFEPINDLAVSNGLRPGITAMLKTLSDEVARYNITINCAAPGMIHTDRTEERIRDYLAKNPGSSREEWLENYVKSIPVGRLGTVEEFAAPVVFLCSGQASYITGGTICLDGGKRRGYH